MKKYNLIITKKRKKLEKAVLLAKTKKNTINFSISKNLIDSDISHNKFVLVNDVLKEYNDIKKAFKNPDNR